jgi:hypothetical protein
MTDVTTRDQYEKARLAAVNLQGALRDSGAEAAMGHPLENGSAVSLLLSLRHSPGREPGLFRGSAESVEDHVSVLTQGLAEGGVRCTVEIRDPVTGLLALRLEEPEDADDLARWVVAGLSPQRAATRRLRRAFAEVGAQVWPQIRGERVDIGSLDPTDTAYFTRALGGVSAPDPDGMADMDPDELEACARAVSARVRRAAGVRLVVDPEPGCDHRSNRLRLGSVGEADAHRLAACLESRVGTTTGRGGGQGEG